MTTAASHLPDGRRVGRAYVRELHVDLTGSRLGPEYLSTKVTALQPADWDDDKLVRLASEHYGIPTGQVTLKPWRKR